MKNILGKLLYALAAVVLVPMAFVTILGIAVFLLVLAVALIPVIAVLAVCGVPINVKVSRGKGK